MVVNLKIMIVPNLPPPDVCLTPKTHYSVAAVFVASKMRKEMSFTHAPHDTVREVSQKLDDYGAGPESNIEKLDFYIYSKSLCLCVIAIYIMRFLGRVMFYWCYM